MSVTLAQQTEAEIEELAILEIQDYEDAENSLLSFCRSAWPIIEPGRKFVENWHHAAICEHLEAVSRGEIIRLIINIPPRSTKSTLVGVMWPAWSWLQDPSDQFLTGSHNSALAVRDNMKTRRIIQSPWYRREWGDRVVMRPDQNQKSRYEFAGGGHRITFGFGSGVLGEGGDKLVIDDPHSAQDGMWSTASRESDLEFYDSELFSRLNDPDLSSIVIVMQRLQVEDLTGHVSKDGDWEILCLPMEYEGENRCNTSLGFVDPRTKVGELLQPSRFSAQWVQKAKVRLGTYGTAGQLQQRPAPVGGGIIDIEWFKRYRVLPSKEDWIEVVQFWDTAQKADEVMNCPWVCGTWVRTKRGLYLKDVFRKWMQYPQGKRMVKSLAKRENPNAVVIEDASTGSSLLQELGQDTRLPLIAYAPKEDKVVRLATESPIIEAGQVFLPDSASWLSDFEIEIGNFPNAATMDQADMLSMALKHFHNPLPEGPDPIDLFNF